MLSAALALQGLAIASIPVVVLGVVISQLSRGQPLAWRHAKMASLLSIAPVIIVLAIRGLLTRWLALLAILVATALGLLAGSARH